MKRNFLSFNEKMVAAFFAVSCIANVLWQASAFGGPEKYYAAFLIVTLNWIAMALPGFFVISLSGFVRFGRLLSLRGMFFWTLALVPFAGFYNLLLTAYAGYALSVAACFAAAAAACRFCLKSPSTGDRLSWGQSVSLALIAAAAACLIVSFVAYGARQGYTNRRIRL